MEELLDVVLVEVDAQVRGEQLDVRPEVLGRGLHLRIHQEPPRSDATTS